MTSVAIDHLGERFVVLYEIEAPAGGEARAPALVAAAGRRVPDEIGSSGGAVGRAIYLFGFGDTAAAIHWAADTADTLYAALAAPPFGPGWRLRVGLGRDHLARIGGQLTGFDGASAAARFCHDAPVVLDREGRLRGHPTMRLDRLGFDTSGPGDPAVLVEVRPRDRAASARTLAVLGIAPRWHKQVSYRDRIVAGDLAEQRDAFAEAVRFASRPGLLLTSAADVALVGFETPLAGLVQAQLLRRHLELRDGAQPALHLGLALGEVVAGPDGPTGSGLAHGRLVAAGGRFGDYPVLLTPAARVALLATLGERLAAACPETTRSIGHDDALAIHELELRGLDLG